MAESTSAIYPPKFYGMPQEDANSFIKSFDRYVKYREINDNAKKLNLLAVLFHDAAADRYDTLPDDHKDTHDHLRAAFNARYHSPEILKFKYAAEIFNRK